MLSRAFHPGRVLLFLAGEIAALQSLISKSHDTFKAWPLKLVFV